MQPWQEAAASGFAFTSFSWHRKLIAPQSLSVLSAPECSVCSSHLLVFSCVHTMRCSHAGRTLPAACALLMVILAVEPASGWETYEFQLFDLMEEVQENFYDFIGVTKDASTSDIKKAYRKLSLKWHPDKRKTPDAEVLFRQLVAVNEVLTDDVKRRRYDELLVVGLPDWKQPVYYYRRVRKLGVAELTGLVMMAVSVIHYAMLWAAYWEKIYELEERWLSRLKRSHKKKTSTDVADEIADLKMSVHRPSWQDFLLCRLLACVVASVKQMPLLYAQCLMCAKSMLKPAARLPDVVDETSEATSVNNQLRGCGKTSVKTEPVVANVQPVVYNPAIPAATGITDVDSGDQALIQADSGKVRPWTEAEVNNLVKAMVKYPVGSFERWDKIATSVGRPVSCVTAKVKELKLHNFHIATVENAGALVRGLKNQPRKLAPEESTADAVSTQLHIVECRDDLLLSQSDRDSETSTTSADPRQASGKPTTMLPTSVTDAWDDGSSASSGTDSRVASASSAWSQQQQKQLENALATVPRSLPDRWDRVAELVPGKSKADCLLRCKDLADKVRNRRQQQQQTTSAS